MARRRASWARVYQVFLLLLSSKVNHHCKGDPACAAGVVDVFRPFLASTCPLQRLWASQSRPALLQHQTGLTAEDFRALRRDPRPPCRTRVAWGGFLCLLRHPCWASQAAVQGGWLSLLSHRHAFPTRSRTPSAWECVWGKFLGSETTLQSCSCCARDGASLLFPHFSAKEERSGEAPLTWNAAGAAPGAGETAAVWVCPGRGTGVSDVRVFCGAQAGPGWEQGAGGSKLGAAAAGAAGPWHSSVPAGAKPEGGHRKRQWDPHLQSLALGCARGQVTHRVGLLSELSAAQDSGLFISGHWKTCAWLGKQLRWGPEAF